MNNKIFFLLLTLFLTVLSAGAQEKVILITDQSKIISLKETAVWFVSAWTFLAVGIFITTGKRLHWLPYNAFTYYALDIENMIEVIVLAMALGDRVRFYQKKKLEAEETLIDADSRILQNRMRPHFLFNSMNIIFQQLKDSPEKAQKTLMNLAENYHFLTENGEKALIPLKEEWAFLKNYLDLMRQRWPDALNVQYDLDSRLENIPVPPVILQPLVENAFKYSLNRLVEKNISIVCYVIWIKH